MINRNLQIELIMEVIDNYSLVLPMIVSGLGLMIPCNPYRMLSSSRGHGVQSDQFGS